MPSSQRVAVANNGKVAIDMLKLFKVDVVLMDINMPVMDGMEATIRIKRTMPDIKILSLTQHNERAMVQKLMDCGIGWLCAQEHRPR